MYQEPRNGEDQLADTLAPVQESEAESESEKF